MRLHRPLALLIAVVGSAALAYSCSSKGSTNPPPPPTYTISKVSGDSQVGSAGTAVGANLVVKVVDQNNAAAAGQTVTWTAASGGGSVTSGTSMTDATGQATMGRTLGAGAGFQTTTASLSGATGSPITFTSISQIGGAFQIAATSGTPQTDTVLATLSQPFVVTVTDYHNNPVVGVTVSFAALTGGHTTPTSALTDASGHAATTFTLDSATGPKLVAATVTGLVGSPVSLNATANAGHADSMALNDGSAQVGATGTSLPVPLSVKILDAHGNGASGTTVNWTFAGGGTLSAPSSISGATGIASVTRTVGTAGVGHDTATASGLKGSPVAFTDTAVAIVGITVADDHFTPQFDTIAVGSFVKFTWAGAVSHTVTWNSAPGSLPAGASARQTGTLTVRLTDLGNYDYYCQIHGSPGAGMYGTIHTQ